MIFNFNPETKINTRELFTEIKQALGNRARNLDIVVLEEPHTRTHPHPSGVDEVFFYGYKVQISGVEADDVEMTAILSAHRPQKSTQEEDQEKAEENKAVTRKEFEGFKADVLQRLEVLERG